MILLRIFSLSYRSTTATAAGGFAAERHVDKTDRLLYGRLLRARCRRHAAGAGAQQQRRRQRHLHSSLVGGVA